jgi:hypothetical protein
MKVGDTGNSTIFTVFCEEQHISIAPSDQTHLKSEEAAAQRAPETH